MLRGLSVADGDDDAAGFVGQRAAGGVIGLDVGDHPATAVEVDQDGEWRGASGGVDADRNRSGGSGDGCVSDVCDRLGSSGLALHLEDGINGVGRAVALADLGRGEHVGRDGSETGQLDQDGLHLGVGFLVGGRQRLRLGRTRRESSQPQKGGGGQSRRR